jgi:hypothetical protein
MKLLWNRRSVHLSKRLVGKICIPENYEKLQHCVSA